MNRTPEALAGSPALLAEAPSGAASASNLAPGSNAGGSFGARPSVERDIAEAQAKRIRAYWTGQGKAVRVETVYVPGQHGRENPGWSVRIVDPVSARPGVAR